MEVGAIFETYIPLRRHLQQPADGIKNKIDKLMYIKIQEKVLSLSIVLLQVEPISRLRQLVPIKINQLICALTQYFRHDIRS